MRAVGDRIEQLVGELRSGLDPVTWRRVEEALSLVTDLYGAGLAVIVREAGSSVVTRLLDDELVASLLVVHGLHPHDLAARVQKALHDVRPYLGSHGGDVEILELDEETGTLRLGLLGSCDGCPSSTATLKYSVERAIQEAAPEIVNLVVEGAADPAPVPETSIQLTAKPVAV